MTAHPPHAATTGEAFQRLTAGDHRIRGDAALRLLDDGSFIAAWSRLCGDCAWATPFQSPPFVLSWYRIYAPRFEPLLLVRAGGDEQLLGLLALAVERGGGGIVAAGAWQAEYQGWLAAGDEQASFANWALAAARELAAGRRLRLDYLPPGAPIGWLRASPLHAVASIITCRRPIMRLDDSDIARSLAKKANKKRIRDMERDFGPVRVRRVSEPGEFAAWMRQAIVFSDARQLALHAAAPFESDPAKAAFHAALAGDSRLTYVSILTAGPTLASLQIGLICRDELQLIFLAHNPFLSRHSPGKIHLYRMAQQLREQGLARIDLTAGGEAYKERFANAVETIYRLSLHPAPMRRLLYDAGATTVRVAKRILHGLNLEPGRTAVAAREMLNPLRLGGALRPGPAPLLPPPAADPDEQIAYLAAVLRAPASRWGRSRRAIVAAALRQIENAAAAPAEPAASHQPCVPPARAALAPAGAGFSQKGRS